jgi:hypothetical protein
MTRTRAEIEGAINGLAIAKQSKEVQLWLKELGLYKERIEIVACNSCGEEAVRYWGMIKAIGLCINLDNVLISENNLANKPNIVRL